MTIKLDNYTITHQLKWRAMHLPHNLALCYLADGEIETERLTYRQLDQAAVKIAARLQSLNLRNKNVLMLYSSGVEFVKAFFGCLYAGAIAVPTYVPKSEQILRKIESIQQDCNAPVILTTQDLLDEDYLKNSKLSGLPIIATDMVSCHAQTEIYNEFFTLPDDIIFIQYTSGSTSQPKGAMVSNANIMVNQVMLQNVFELSESSVGVTWLPLFHDMGLIASLLNAIYVGYPIYIMPPSAFIRNPLRWLQCITKYKGTYTCAPNFAYDLCNKSIPLEARADLDLSSLKKAINASEHVQPDTLKEFTKQFAPYGFSEKAFTPAYGLAEATVFVTGKSDSVIKYIYLENEPLKNNKIVYSERAEDTKKIVSCGIANQLNQKIKIVNPVTLEQTTDEIGEICISGEHIVKGYLNKPDVNEEIFGLKIGGKKYLRTGDLGFVDKGDHLYITGRIKDVIIINGRNYYPQDVEQVAESKSPHIRNNATAAFSIEVDNKERLVIVVELNKKMLADFDSQKLGSDINSAVLHANSLIAYEIVFIKPGALPKTTSGKIQRQACKKMYLANELSIQGAWKSAYEYESDSVQQKLVVTPAVCDVNEITNRIIQFVAQKLKTNSNNIKAQSRFSDFNFDSIQMAALSVELEKITQQSLPDKIFYGSETIEHMSEAIVQQLAHHPETRTSNVYQLKPKQQKAGRKIVYPKFQVRSSRKIS